MGLDIYAGTLTRYQSGNWKSVVQQYAEENNILFNRVTSEPEDILPPDEVREILEGWRDSLLKALDGAGMTGIEPWVEDNDAPYFTDKPDWDAFGAMLTVLACKVYDMPYPEKVSRNWDFQNHPAYKRMCGDERCTWSLFKGAEWWIPVAEYGSYFTVPLPNGNEAVVSTTGALFSELKRLNERLWQADEETILSWRTTEGYTADAEIPEGAPNALRQHGKSEEYDTMSLAKMCYSIFYRAVRFARENGAAVVMDY